jgi:hypothetical protein
MIPLEHFRTIDYVHVREGRLVYLQKFTGIPSAPYLQPTGVRTRGNDMRFLVPFTSVNSYKNSFFPSTIRLWISLPSDITRMQSLGLEAFQQQTNMEKVCDEVVYPEESTLKKMDHVAVTLLLRLPLVCMILLEHFRTIEYTTQSCSLPFHGHLNNDLDNHREKSNEEERDQ